MTKPKRESLAQRIERERFELDLKPWQFAPSEVDNGPIPYQSSSAGFVAWVQAQKWRAEIRARDPDYFAEQG